MSAGKILLSIIFPYVAIAVFVVGHWWRYRRDQFTWTSRSTQLLDRRILGWASPAFHYGALAAVGGHIIGLCSPHAWTDAIGISEHTYRWRLGLARIQPGRRRLDATAADRPRQPVVSTPNEIAGMIGGANRLDEPIKGSRPFQEPEGDEDVEDTSGLSDEPLQEADAKFEPELHPRSRVGWFIFKGLTADQSRFSLRRRWGDWSPMRSLTWLAQGVSGAVPNTRGWPGLGLAGFGSSTSVAPGVKRARDWRTPFLTQAPPVQIQRASEAPSHIQVVSMRC